MLLVLAILLVGILVAAGVIGGGLSLVVRIVILVASVLVAGYLARVI
jgi:hypothetical protein